MQSFKTFPAIICIFFATTTWGQERPSNTSFEIQAGWLHSSSIVKNSDPRRLWGGAEAREGAEYEVQLRYNRKIYKGFSGFGSFGYSLQGRSEPVNNFNFNFDHHFLGIGVGGAYQIKMIRLDASLIGQYLISNKDSIYNSEPNEFFQFKKYDLGYGLGMSIQVPKVPKLSVYARYSRMFSPHQTLTFPGQTNKAYRQNISVGLAYQIFSK
jgi:opacity protein-like surface antigen